MITLTCDAQAINEDTDYRAMCTVLQSQLDELLDRQRQQNRYAMHQRRIKLICSSVMLARYEDLKQKNSQLSRELNSALGKYEQALEDADEAQVQARVAKKQCEVLTERIEVGHHHHRLRPPI